MEENLEEGWEMKILLYKGDLIFVLNTSWKTAEKTKPDYVKKCTVVGWEATETIFCKGNSDSILRMFFINNCKEYSSNLCQ